MKYIARVLPRQPYTIECKNKWTAEPCAVADGYAWTVPEDLDLRLVYEASVAPYITDVVCERGADPNLVQWALLKSPTAKMYQRVYR